MTNLEYLRTLRAEELEKVIKGDECATCTFSGKSICCCSCDEGFIEWLKQERGPELKPCPFCGGKARVWYETEDTWSFASCEECGAEVRGNTKSEVTEAWNRRTK